MSIFGAKVAVIYVIVGLMIAVAGGTLIEKLHMEPYVEEFVRAAGGVDIESPTLTKRERIQYAREQVISTFKKYFHTFWLVWELAQSFTTGFQKAGLKRY